MQIYTTHITCKGTFLLPYNHEYLHQWDKACVLNVQLLFYTHHRLVLGPPDRTVSAFLHVLYKTLGHSCFCPPWRIHKPSSARCSPLFLPWRLDASTKDSSLSPHCLVCPSCLSDSLHKSGVCKLAPQVDWEYSHKLDRKGHPLYDQVWLPFSTALWWRGRNAWSDPSQGLRCQPYFTQEMPSHREVYPVLWCCVDHAHWAFSN